MRSLGQNPTDQELRDMVNEVDADGMALLFRQVYLERICFKLLKTTQTRVQTGMAQERYFYDIQKL